MRANFCLNIIVEYKTNVCACVCWTRLVNKIMKSCHSQDQAS